MAWVKVASRGDIEEGALLPAKIGENEIALCAIDGEYYAIDNICTHALAYLSEGFLDDHIIECPLHGGCFDVRTGQGQGMPITEDLKTYPVRVDGEDVLVELQD